MNTKSEITGFWFYFAVDGDYYGYKDDNRPQDLIDETLIIFGTCFKILLDFIGKRKPNAITYGAIEKGSNRDRLYQTFSNRLNKQLPEYKTTNSPESAYPIIEDIFGLEPGQISLYTIAKTKALVLPKRK